MNLMSSMAKTLVGSPMAIVRVAPVLLTGRTPYLRATSPGTILITAASISKLPRSIEGTPNCWESVSVMSFSVTAPTRTSASPSLPPSSRWDFKAASSCSWEISFALSRRSPNFTAMEARDCTLAGTSLRLEGHGLDGLELPDQRPHLQLGAELDGNPLRVVRQPQDQVPADEAASRALGLDPDRLEFPGRDLDRLLSLDLDGQDVRLAREDVQRRRLPRVQRECPQVVDRGERVERRVLQGRGLAVLDRHGLLVVELRQL